MANIRHLIQIIAEPKQIYLALTTAEGIRQWWTDNADLENTVGGTGVFRFHYTKQVETVVKIVGLSKDEAVSWTVLNSFRTEQNGTSITFQLRKVQNQTSLYFSQTGFTKESETYALMSTGWAYYLVSLKLYLETGHGAPSPNVNLGIMTN